MTFSTDQQPTAVDPLASQRLALLGQAAGAQIALEALIASLRASAAPVPPDVTAQQGEIAALLREIANAGPAELPALQRAVATAVANAAQQAQPDPGARGVALAEATEASRRAVQSALDYTATLDLQFTSAEDERAYREREAERRAYIAAQNALGTPQGNLNAAGAAVVQMADAKAHGAGGPEFAEQWHNLFATTERLRAAAQANGVSTDEFDRRLREDLRRILKSKGLSDAQIDAQFAANADPLQAVKAYVESADIGSVDRVVSRVDTSVHDVVLVAAKPNEVANITLADAMAALREAGVAPSDAPSEISGAPATPFQPVAAPGHRR